MRIVDGIGWGEISWNGDIWGYMDGQVENAGGNWDGSIEDGYGWELGWNMEYGIWE